MDILKEILHREPQVLAFCLVGFFFLCYPVYANIHASRLARRRTGRCRGTVVDETLRHGGHGPGLSTSHHVPTRHPVAVYEVEGQTFRLVSETGASWQTLRRGQTVNIRYNPANPEDADIDDIALQSVEHLLLFFFPLLGAGLFFWNLFKLLRFWINP